MPTISEIAIAIFLVAVTAAVIVWFQRSLATASARRMVGMMTRIGLDPENVAPGDPRAGAVMREIRQRCRRCPCEGFCERWLAGEVEGDNAFCRNAELLGGLADASGQSA